MIANPEQPGLPLVLFPFLLQTMRILPASATAIRLPGVCTLESLTTERTGSPNKAFNSPPREENPFPASYPFPASFRQLALAVPVSDGFNGDTGELRDFFDSQ